MYLYFSVNFYTPNPFKLRFIYVIFVFTNFADNTRHRHHPAHSERAARQRLVSVRTDI